MHDFSFNCVLYSLLGCASPVYCPFSAVRYIETFHKWAGTAANPSSPWHNQQMGMMGSPGMMSNSPGPSSAVFMMDD